MKILMLTWEYPPRIVGGIARVVNDLSKRLIKDGHDVYVVTYREGSTPYYENDKGVHVYRVDNYMINPNNFIDWIMQLNFNMVAKVNELIAKGEKFDVIHAHDWLVAYAAKTLKNSYDLPLVSTIHATEAGRNGGIHDEVQRYINDTEWMLTYESSEVIVNSKFMKNDLQRLFGLPYEKINVVANGINSTAYSGVEKDYDFRRQYAADNEKIILFMGRLVYEKGVQHLISAMPKILENYHVAIVVIACKGGMLFGIVALEAMLAGVPTVVSDVGGLNEIVEHGVDGMKSYAGNPNSLADSILELLFNPQLCESISKKAKTKVKNEYSWTKIAQDTHFIYQKAICQTMAERQAHQIAQENAKKEKKIKSVETEITNLISFNKKRQAYA